jgi:hypothetical protein
MKTYELTVAVVYCPPRHNIKEDNFYEFFRTLGNDSSQGVITTARTHYGDLV